MASNDEYQQQQFWENIIPPIRVFVIETDIKRANRNNFLVAPLDNVEWTKTVQGWEFKTK